MTEIWHILSPKHLRVQRAGDINVSSHQATCWRKTTLEVVGSVSSQIVVKLHQAANMWRRGNLSPKPFV